MSLLTREAPTRLTVDGYVDRAANDAATESRFIDIERRAVDYVCSTDTLDSHGTVLRQNWRLDRYARNPVVLFAHNSRSIPVGTASNVRVENGRLMARVTFADGEVCEEAEECWRAVKAGLLRGISVGFLAHSSRWETEGDVERFVLDDLELLELSVCAVPSNPDTLAQRSALTTLRAQALAQRTAPKDSPAMTPEEIKALRDEVISRAANETRLSAALASRDADLLPDLASRDADLTSARTSLEAARTSLEAARTDLTAARADAEAQRSLVAKLNAEADALKARADAAEDKVARLEIEGRIGKDVDPAEVDDLLAVRRSNPDAFARMLARRASRNDALTEQVIPTATQATTRDAAPANPTASLMAAISQLSPKE
jgi:HK97 family phage prohead protease